VREATRPSCPEGRGLLKDEIVVITAAAGTGIGGATARRCLEEGARVLVSDAHERRLRETAAELADAHGPDAVAARPCDVTDERQVRALYAAALDRFGRIDVAVNNAGLGGTADLADMTDEQWDRVLDVTLGGTFRCTRAALRIMREQEGGGVIVNNASVVGWRAQRGQSHYAAAKAGVMALTRCAALEAASYGAAEAYGRHAEPWEVANVIVFLAGDYSSYMTGEVVSVSCQHP
jgi:3-oxoacyl-[acyl-carrier protein] reductase